MVSTRSRGTKKTEKTKVEEVEKGGGGNIAEYEETRAQRIKENMERMKSLGIVDFSRELKRLSYKPSSALRKTKPTLPPSNDPLRRSSRFQMKGGKLKADSADSRLAVRKEKIAAKDPNKPKRPGSAFFIFMEDFRKQYQEKHPDNKSVGAVGKAGGDKWKSMRDEEKAPFVAKAEKRKEEYEQKMEAYNRMLGGGDEYEETRAQRIKENMERMKSLGILDLSRELKHRSPKPSSLRKMKPTFAPSNDPPRRSSRFQMKEEKSKADSADNRHAVRKEKTVAKDPNKPKRPGSVRKEEKTVAKDPNKPKRPGSAFCVFLEDFWKQYQEKHPDNKSVAAVSHFSFHCFYSAGDKWRSMNDEEKAPFIAKAEKRMEEYEQKMEAYNRKLTRKKVERFV